jgi:methyltransferase family protein
MAWREEDDVGMRRIVGAGEHWDDAYRLGEMTRSWFQLVAESSLRMLDAVGCTPDDSVIDVGGGASRLVDALLDRGYRDITVLDISNEGLQTAQRRVGAAGSRVGWLVADLLQWRPARTWTVWHDRAVLHFFTEDLHRSQYVRCLKAATTAGSIAVLATFAPDGPAQCSGLPVTRYDATGLAELLGADWDQVSHTREEHVTPSGAMQPFTWAAFRRSSGR